ncbi:predicted protein [Pyrenophora tritici-repentis Pt-1C-BFP]|uniref:Uncharacterized protein n=1 Tax=Pyrenophora tritici-repentis (strain Pt-1C-BFP) TaxID=426418 RepID=B2W6B2_PYRTR|nr:uncharacterized protein PTRG_05350 [Pyrenophora tritici-repentis Pt-1C-BFP]EDU48270.1 predicted protein [Pyrenophora tritici-repentis Pt-1C-BFP]
MADDMRYGHQHARGPPRGEDGEFKIRGQAEQTRPMSRSQDQTEGDVTTEPPAQDIPQGLNTSTRLRPQDHLPRNSRSRTSRRAKELRKLATAEENAANYPPLDDTRAWQALGRETDSTTRDNSAFVYRHLRRAQCPKALSFPEWVKDVHREMEGLGLQDTGRYIRRDWQEAGGPVEEIEMVQETVAVQEEVDVVQERKYEDDGFDIDIYGDEETRAKYEPWIRSQIGRGTSKL